MIYSKIYVVVLGFFLYLFSFPNDIFMKKAVAEQKIKIEKVKFVGNTIYSQEQLEKIILPLLNKTSSIDELIEIREKITDLYVNNGYISSAAIIPPQNIGQDNLIIIRIIEGKLKDILIEKNNYIQDKYILARLPKKNEIFNINDLKFKLEQLYNDPFIKNINAQIQREKVGDLSLKIKLDIQNRLNGDIVFSNSYSDNIGNLGSEVNLDFHVLGYGDILNIGLIKAEGLDQYSLLYTFPINTYNTTIDLYYTKANTRIVDEDLKELNIKGKSDLVHLALNHPIQIDESSKLDLKAKLSISNGESFILDDFSLSLIEGLENNKNKITELSLIQTYSKTGNKSYIYLISSFNIGLPILESTETQNGRDGEYFSWDVAATQYLKLRDNLIFISNVKGQITQDNLLPSKQFYIGGLNSVRGYDANSILNDNGISISNELQFLFIDNNVSKLKLITFLDGGSTWSSIKENRQRKDLMSLGMGLEYSLNDHLTINVTYAIPVVNFDDNIQENVGFAILFSS